MLQQRVAIYNRCSTEEEAQVNALSIQAQESREKALAMGFEVVAQYIESESGTTSYKRSEYQRLLEDMEQDKFDIVMIKSIDRLMRSAKDWYLFLDKLTLYHKKLYIYIDNKYYTPDDSLITGIKAILAEDFSRELSKKIKNSHKRRQMQKSGLNITRPMFGWDKIGKDTYVINEKEAEAYREAFEIIKEGKGFYTLANRMEQKGICGKNGKTIAASQWRKMLYSLRAHGTVILHTTEYDFNTKKRYFLPESEWIYVENALPPIVSKEYHKEFLEMLATRTEKNNFYNYTRDMTKVGTYELSGKLCCALCGSVYYRTKYDSGLGSLAEWKCSKAIKNGRKTEKNRTGCNNCNVMEDVVLDEIQNTCKKQYDVIFGEEEIAGEIFEMIKKVLQNDDEEKKRRKKEKELEALKRKKNILLQKLLDEVITDMEFKKFNSELSCKIEHLEKEIVDSKEKGKDKDALEKRLVEIREVLEEGKIIIQAKTKEMIFMIEKIMVHSDHTLEIIFDKEKLLAAYPVNGEKNRLDENDFRMLVPYVHKNNIVKKREEVAGKILEIWKNNPDIMLKEIPAMTGMSESYVNTCVKQLKEKGLIEYQRNGNTHKGKWLVRQ
ncbi:MAG: recombinase family protein [Lachnospiraceae bacterium]|nr:recombinase family protein [Lachnospiraceae bacterium]